MNSKTAIIITSIASPNAVLKAYAEKCAALGVEFIVVGDVTSPPIFQLEGCRFCSIDEQNKFPFKLSKLLPEKHYSRKNIGYLLSKDKEVIIETDDDNMPLPEFWNVRQEYVTAYPVEKRGWFNVYQYYSEQNLWPRGFPIEAIATGERKVAEGIGQSTNTIFSPIQQGLADGNPDVDAIYRIAYATNIVFEKKPPLSLLPNTWCPFNSQNTSWHKDAFLLLYLPSYCSFRMTDIWRSFIAQRIAWTCNWNILFHQATVFQERNEHSLLKDFADEVPGYLNNSMICRKLEELDLKAGKENMSENLMRCYQMMVRENYIKETELQLLEAWIYDLS